MHSSDIWVLLIGFMTPQKSNRGRGHATSWTTINPSPRVELDVHLLHIVPIRDVHGTPFRVKRKTWTACGSVLATINFSLTYDYTGGSFCHTHLAGRREYGRVPAAEMNIWGVEAGDVRYGTDSDHPRFVTVKNFRKPPNVPALKMNRCARIRT